ncbi:PDZ domain-containing protein [Streptomyces sp. DSM 118878]
MEHSALRPKPLPGQDHSGAPRSRTDDPAGSRGDRPYGVRRRGRRLAALLCGLGAAVLLVVCGVGIGTVGATVIGMSRLAEMREGAGYAVERAGMTGPGGAGKAVAKGAGAADTRAMGGAGDPAAARERETPRTPRPPARTATLGVEAVDAPRGPGALLVGLHVPGPGHTAGLARGDTLLAFGRSRIDSAAELAARVAAARPDRTVTLTVRHATGERQLVRVRPGVVT